MKFGIYQYAISLHFALRSYRELFQIKSLYKLIRLIHMMIYIAKMEDGASFEISYLLLVKSIW